MPLTIKQLHPLFAAEVEGLELSPELSDAQVALMTMFAAMQDVPVDLPPSESDLLLLYARGRQDFTTLGCAECHVPNAYTSPESYDVGFVDEQGNREFNPPSLRGVSQRRPYFHDNRAGTLDDVIQKFQHQLNEPLPANEAKSLLAFLRSL